MAWSVLIVENLKTKRKEKHIVWKESAAIYIVAWGLYIFCLG